MHKHRFGGLAEIALVSKVRGESLDQIGALRAVVFDQRTDDFIAKGAEFGAIFQLKEQPVDIQFAKVQRVRIGEAARHRERLPRFTIGIAQADETVHRSAKAHREWVVRKLAIRLPSNTIGNPPRRLNPLPRLQPAENDDFRLARLDECALLETMHESMDERLQTPVRGMLFLRPFDDNTRVPSIGIVLVAPRPLRGFKSRKRTGEERIHE